mmetsp:Transcript_11819/g.32555  ORF Transcript_11819/g.32555 Transcript_11819/m.32555 type:complete len:111 (-) Transcript_11819:100-432(-)
MFACSIEGRILIVWCMVLSRPCGREQGGNGGRATHALESRRRRGLTFIFGAEACDYHHVAKRKASHDAATWAWDLQVRMEQMLDRFSGWRKREIERRSASEIFSQLCRSI